MNAGLSRNVKASVELSPVHVVEVLRNESDERLAASKSLDGVLFLIGYASDCHGEPFLILTKRSSRVRQPGDLCCPGGRIHKTVDRVLGWMLRIRCSPLTRSRGWKARMSNPLPWRRGLAMYWACCLRESWEELGLRPWRVEFLGLLPVYHLSLFNRKILPMVGWTSGTVDFRPNWEVSRIVRIPIPSLLRPESYAVYSLRLEGGRPYPDGLEQPHFPCFIHRDHEGQEVLWGATYHIVLSFLERVFGFQPPPASGRWIIQGVLPETYAADRDLP